MKKTLTHLPENKVDELKKVVSIIRKQCDDVEMIILFGSYARGDYKIDSDLKAGRKSGHISDYDILVVTGEKKSVDNAGLWTEITKECNSLKQSTHARIIAHDIQELNIKLAEGQYFYTDVKKEGCLLYDSGKFQLAIEHELTPKEQKRIAQEGYDHWFKRAKDFLKVYSFCFNENDFEIAAFNLHQATEASYKTILLVFTNYNPNEHYLKMLGGMASEEDASLSDIFPLKTEEEQERFRKLDYAYIGARYDPAFRITKADLEILATHVKKLLELTEKICKAKIEGFNDEG